MLRWLTFALRPLCGDSVLFHQRLLTGFQVRNRLRIFKRDGSMQGQRFHQLFVFGRELSFGLVQHLKNADDLAANISQGNPQNIPGLKSCFRIYRWIKQRRFVRILNDDILARNQDSAGDSKP